MNRHTSVENALAFLELGWDGDGGCDAEDGGEDCNELHNECFFEVIDFK